MLDRDIRKQFPIIENNANMVYLDTAATCLVPNSVVGAMSAYYQNQHSNIHRGNYSTARWTTTAVEHTRAWVAEFLGASMTDYHVVFTSGFTGAANIVADQCRGLVDSVTVSLENHHSHLLPFLRTSPVVNSIVPGPLDNFPSIEGRSLICIPTIGNVYGEEWPVARLCKQANKEKHWLFLDLAQSVGRMRHQLGKWRPAFAAFSAHKMYGPTGIGALLIRRDVAEVLNENHNASVSGGGTVESVTVDLKDIGWANLPYKLEAGTINIAGVFGLKAAMEWMKALDLDEIAKHDQEITDYLVEQLEEVEDVDIIGAGRKRGLVSFNVANHCPNDIAISLGSQNVCVRSGGLCAHVALGDQIAARASVGVYTTKEDIDSFITALNRTISKL
jgi:cysteine desulfurase/selenocysteine lyase